MAGQTAVPTASAAETQAQDAQGEVPADDELLVEEVSIDGMCGVY